MGENIVRNIKKYKYLIVSDLIKVQTGRRGGEELKEFNKELLWSRNK